MTIIRDIYKSIFGKSYEDVWRQFASENNGTFLENGAVEIVYQKCKIMLDTYIHYSVVGGKSYDTEFTRVRLEFKSPDNLRLRLTKQAFVDNIGKLFGVQDIQIGDKVFDKRFMIKGNDEYKIQTIFSNEIVKNLVLLQSDIHLQILDKEGIFDEPVQDGFSMLYYISETGVKEKEQLNALLKLFTALVDELTKLRSLKDI